MTRARRPYSRLRLTLLLGIAACAPSAPTETRWLELLQIRPAERAEVFLNERIVLHFSELVDPTSVHGDSLRITGDDGRPARGAWSVVSDRIEFTPAPVLSPDLSDGGFRPGARYWVDLVGFPAPDGLHGRSGAPLASNLRWEFRVVAVDGRDGRPVFEDTSPTRGLPLVLATPVLAEGEPIVLSGEEPVDPSSLEPGDFRLSPQRDLRLLKRGADIPLTVRLVQNYDKHAAFPRGGTLLELRPRDALLEPGNYVLRLTPQNGRVDDLGGHPMLLVSPTSTRSLEVIVQPGRRATRSAIERHIESFATPQSRSSEAWEGADGMAWWRDSGRVEVRFPRAAGNGIDGDFALLGELGVEDLHATRLELDAKDTAELTRSSGVVILRSQGAARIAGALTRRRGAPRATAECEPEWLVWMQHAALDADAALESLREQNVAATVLIAGGDLVIEGRIDSPTPLILLAGGRIRVARGAVVEAPRVFFVDLATESIGHYLGGHRIGAAVRMDWELTAADRNVLRTPLRFAVLSGSLPAGGAQRFELGPRVTSHHGAGRARVRFVGDPPVGSSTRTARQVVEDPALLQGCSTLRILVELEVFPPDAEGQERWDPPWVDDVMLDFVPAETGGG